jgi:D-alanyl-D-alanine-carboxypeptidase/D-alanyl-D-alanine-endopeptidase
MNPNIFELPGNDKISEILVRRTDQQKHAVGIAVGIVVRDGSRVVAHGRLAMGDARAVDGDTIFEIGSVSKIFTSLLLADMVNRKEVALGDAAAKYLPAHVKMPERGGKSITLLDLSTHTSGLPALPGNQKLGSDAVYAVNDLYEFLSGYMLPRDPGSEFEYSNLGAGLLGHLLANRAGTDYESLVRSRIVEPLNMASTGITPSLSMKERMATGHNAMLTPVANLELATLAGAGALRSSGNDMVTFLGAFLGYRESSLAPAMKAMLEFRRLAGQAKIGLAWLVCATDGREIVWHNGATAGFRSFVGFDPIERAGVVALSNVYTAAGVDDIGFHLLNPKAPLANIEPPKERIQVPIDPKLLDNYTGRYRMTPNLIFEITREGDRLFGQGFAQLPQNRSGDLTALPKFELFAEGEKEFFARVSDSQIRFQTDAAGRGTSLTLYRASRAPTDAVRLP